MGEECISLDQQMNNQILQEQYYQMQKELMKQWQESQTQEEEQDKATLMTLADTIRPAEEQEEGTVPKSTRKKAKSTDTIKKDSSELDKLDNKRLVIIEESQNRYTGTRPL